MIFRTISDDITGANKSIGLFGKSLNDFKRIINSFKQNGFASTLFNTSLNNIDTDAIDNYNIAIRSSIPHEQALAIARKTTNAETIALIESSHGAEVQIERVTAAQKASTIAAKTQSIAFKALSVAGNIAIFMLITKGIQLASSAIDDWIHKTEKARERTSELFDEFREMNNTLADHKKTAAELAGRYDQLLKGVNPTNNENVSLSTEEYEEFLNINKQLADAFPELAKGIDKNGNSILTLGTKGITSKEQLEELLQTEEALNNFRISKGLGEAFEGVYTYIEESNEAFDKLNGSISDSSQAMGKLQGIAENGIKLNSNYNQLIFSGNTNNLAELDYMNALTDSVNEFWKSLDADRRVELDVHGTNDATLFSYKLDEYTGAFEVYSQAYNLSPEELTTLESIIQEKVKNVNGVLLDSIDAQSQELQSQIEQGENAWTDFIPSLVSSMKSKQTFKNLDSDLQDIAVRIVEGLDYSYASAIKDWNPDDPYAYIRDNLIVPMGDLSDDDKNLLKSSYEDLLQLDAEDISQNNQIKITNLIDTIASLLKKDPIEIRATLGFDVEDVQNKYNEALKKAKQQLGGYTYDDKGFEINNDIGETLDDFWNENIITEKDWALWEKVTESITDASKAMDTYTKAKEKNDAEALSDIPSTISSSIRQISKQLEPQFSKLGEAYKAIFTDDGFIPRNVDNAMLESLRKSFEEIEEEAGVTFDASNLDSFFNTLINGNSISEVQLAFNDLASAYLNSTDTLKQLDDETAGAIARQLELMGVSNAQELVEGALIRKKYQLLTASKKYIEASAETKQAMFDECFAGETLEQAVNQISLQRQIANANALDTSADVDAIFSLAQAAGFSAESLYHLAEARDFLMEAETSGDADQISEAKEGIRRIVALEQQKLANYLQYTGTTPSNKTKDVSTTGSGRDAHLEEYQKKLANLQTMLDQELINQKEFYDQSDALLNEYLKDTPAHMQKYADEISNAEKTLRGNWISSFGYEKSQLEKDLSDSTLVQWQYYEHLSELAEQYYNTEGASYGKFADEYDEITREIKEGQEKLWDDIFSEVNSQLDNLQSACETVRDAIAEYSENGSLSIDTMQKLIALEPQYLAMLFDENGQLQLNTEAYERLAQTKLEELKVDLAGQALNTINGLQNEAQAVEMLTGKYAELRDISADAIEQQLRTAVAEARVRGENQGKAAEMVLESYINQKKILDAADLSFNLTPDENDSNDDKFLKEFNWIETLLKKISDKTSKLADKVDKFYNWQKKNSMINRAVKATDKEISQNQLAYQAYMKKAGATGLWLNYVRKVQNGTLSIEDITDESLSNRIDAYKEWYDKAQECLDTIEDLYDRQRDLIRQKLDNVLDYYNDMDSYLSSITSKIESVISLNDEIGKRTSLTELVEQFAGISNRVDAVTAPSTESVFAADGSLGDSKNVADAVKRDTQKLIRSIQSEIDNLDVKKSGNYTKLLDNIAKTKQQIDRYENNGWDQSKAKAYEKLQDKLRNYYDLQKALDENATSDTVGNYERIYTAYQKLQNKINSGKSLSRSEQKRYDTYAGQLDGLKTQGQSALDKLYAELEKADGTAPKQTEADRINSELDRIQSDLEGTAIYQNLLKNIEAAESKIAGLDEKGYDRLTGGQKKTYDKLKTQLEAYYAQKESLDENATAANIAEYNKIYLAWRKLQDKLDSGQNLSESQWKQYNSYTKQLENYADKKADAISKLNDALKETLNPSDRTAQLEKTYEESAKGIYESYQRQIDGINDEAENTKQYQNLLAKAQKLEQKKDTKGLSKSEQANLDKYNAELEALQTGASGNNISDYMKTWEAWYKLQQKLDSGKKLSDSEARKYDTYRAQLEAWNGEKQTQINDLLSLMEDDLAQLQKTCAENMSEADSEVNDYYENLYSLAKQIAEYNITSLQTQLDYLDSYISYYKELVSLYDSFSGEKLTKILTDLDENALAKKTDVYEKYLNTLQDKYNTTLAEMNEYRQLLGALDSNDFESSMELFNKAMENYKSEGNDAMADKLQSVLNLLNERAADADSWDEYADQWANEWEEALSSAKQELIGTASEIQDINDALREIRFENITDAIEELDRAAGILSSIEGLIQDDWLFDDGQMTEYGRAKTALLVSQLEDAQAKADAYLDLYNEIQNNKDTYASDKAYQTDLNDALQNYYDALGSAASFENSIMDLMKQNAKEEINSLKDIIEARKKALQSKKEYYDYDKSIRNSQKEIDSLKAQIDALENLSGATDAATKAKLAQLRAELAQKEESLQETKDEHTFNLQIDALDEFADSLTNALDNSSKSVEEILKEQKETVESAKELYQTSAESISGILQKLEAFYKGKGSLSDEALLGLVGENVFQYAQANTPQIAFHAETAIPDIIRERNAAPPINVHYDSLIHVEGNIDKEVADLLPKQLEQSYQYVVQQIYSDIRSVSGVKPAARSVI